MLPGDDTHAVKDPVVLQDESGLWHLWASVHPLEPAGAEDRMTTEHYTSSDGIDWVHNGRALDRLPNRWDSRGVRVTAVLPGDIVTAWYDGRASAEENWEERTGIATGADSASFVVDRRGGRWRNSPYAPGGLRYLSVVTLPNGEGHRLYYEATRADGAHELRTQLVRTSQA